MRAGVKTLEFRLPRRTAPRCDSKDVEIRLRARSIPDKVAGPAATQLARVQWRGELASIAWQLAVQAGFGQQVEQLSGGIRSAE